jgi:hypothetical protein
MEKTLIIMLLTLCIPLISAVSINSSSSILTNVTDEGNFTHLKIIGDTSTPWRGFNYTTRTAFVPYFKDDDNSYANFDGVNDYVNTTITQGPDNHSITYSFWFKTTITGKTEDIMYKYQDQAANFIYLRKNTLGQVSANFYDGTITRTAATTVIHSDNNWHSFISVLNKDTGLLILYIDGANTTAGTSITTLKTINNTGKYLFADGCLSGNYFNGSIDNILIINRSLNSTEVTSLYNLGRKDISYTDTKLINAYRFDDTNASVARDTIGTNNGTFTGGTQYSYDTLGLVAYYPFDVKEDVNVNKTYDYSNNSNDGTLTGGTAFNTSCVYGNCYKFDGANDYITVPHTDSLNLNSLTLSVWIKTSNLKYQGIIKKMTTAATTQAPYDLFVTNGGLITFSVNAEVGTLTTTKVITDGNFHLITATYNGTTMNIYIDSVLNKSLNYATASIGTNTLTLIIGDRWSTGQFFNGSIDEVMIFNTALNSSQISDIYNNQSRRFKSSGIQTLQSTNITNGSYSIRLNSSFNSFSKSYIQVNTTNVLYKNLTGLDIFSISTLDNNITFSFNFTSDNYGFYTPNLISLNYDLLCYQVTSRYLFFPTGCKCQLINSGTRLRW